MKRAMAASLAVAVTSLPGTAYAEAAPPILISEANPVETCATPGRLTAFLNSRNERLDPRFEKIAVEYMRHGERLGIRWDYAFYQMLLETGYLSFRDRGRPGDVSPGQNNFAGLGATGNGVSGESFPDVSSGVLAHLQHVLVYAGETVADPVAERTRKVQEWGVLKSMQKRARGSVTFAHLATKWAPGANYVAGLEAIAGRFREGFCRNADPHPEWIAEARGQAPAATAAADEASTERISGAALARRAIAEGDGRRSGLGAAAIGKGATALAPATPSYSLLNREEASGADDIGGATARRSTPKTAKTPPVVTASAAGSLVQMPPAKSAPEAKPPAGRCRVWTASYGGQKALIIRVNSDKGVDYTVLDVNEGAERREAEAFIAAYAKGGAVEAEFSSQAQALEKAFELCPES